MATFQTLSIGWLVYCLYGNIRTNYIDSTPTKINTTKREEYVNSSNKWNSSIALKNQLYKQNFALKELEYKNRQLIAYQANEEAKKSELIGDIEALTLEIFNIDSDIKSKNTTLKETNYQLQETLKRKSNLEVDISNTLEIGRKKQKIYNQNNENKKFHESLLKTITSSRDTALLDKISQENAINKQKECIYGIQDTNLSQLVLDSEVSLAVNKALLTYNHAKESYKKQLEIEKQISKKEEQKQTEIDLLKQEADAKTLDLIEKAYLKDASKTLEETGKDSYNKALEYLSFMMHCESNCRSNPTLHGALFKYQALKTQFDADDHKFKEVEEALKAFGRKIVSLEQEKELLTTTLKAEKIKTQDLLEKQEQAKSTYEALNLKFADSQQKLTNLHQSQQDETKTLEALQAKLDDAISQFDEFDQQLIKLTSKTNQIVNDYQDASDALNAIRAIKIKQYKERKTLIKEIENLEDKSIQDFLFLESKKDEKVSKIEDLNTKNNSLKSTETVLKNIENLITANKTEMLLLSTEIKEMMRDIELLSTDIGSIDLMSSLNAPPATSRF